MKFLNKQKNNFTSNRGFTLIETMVAVLILSTSLASLLSLSTNSLFTAKYANNEITANYLLQEAVDYIRNNRDSVVFQQASTGGGWTVFLNKFGKNSSSGCFSANGCYLDIGKSVIESIDPQMTSCGSVVLGGFGSIKCPVMNYDENSTPYSFYTENAVSGAIKSNFKREIKMRVDDSNHPNELDIIVKVEWRNGNLTHSRSMESSLLNWQSI